MPQVISDYVFNPTPIDRHVSFCGKMFTFPKYGYWPVVMHRDLTIHMSGLDHVKKVLEPVGCFVLEHAELAGGADRDNMTDDQRRAYAIQYLERLRDMGLNQCIDSLRQQFIDYPEADNRKLAMANKAPMPETRHAKMMLVRLKELEMLMTRTDRLGEEQEISKIAREVRNMPEIDLDVLPKADLQRMAKDIGVNPLGLSKDKLIELIQGTKAEPPAPSKEAGAAA